MDELRNTRRNLLVVVAVGALFISAVGVVALAQEDGGEVFTGCVNQNSGVLKNVAIGSDPVKPCNEEELQITWNETGPEGPPGPPGPPAQAEPLDLFVDCDAGDTVGAVLADAGPALGPVNITMSGVCEESVNVRRDDVSFRGTQRSDGIRAGSTDPFAVGLFGARDVGFSNMTISGGTGGGAFGSITANRSTFDASDITVRDSSVDGIKLLAGSSAFMSSCTIADNSGRGVDALSGSGIVLDDCEITGNGQIGASATSASIEVFNSHIAHNGTLGLNISKGGFIGISSSTIEENPEGGVLNGGELAIGGLEGPPTRIANNGFGVRLGGGSSATIAEAIIEGNFLGISVGEGSHAGVSSTIVRENTEDGIRIFDLSTVFVGTPETQIIDNGGWGIFCGGPPAVAVRGGQVRYLPETVFSGNALGDTNCQ